MLFEFEKFLEKYPNILNLFNSLGTWAAVIVALWLGLKSSKPKLTACATLSYIIPSRSDEPVQPTDYPLVLSLSITNHGPQPAYFDYFGSVFWKVPFGKGFAIQNPSSDFRNTDIELLPGKSTSFVLIDKPQALFVEQLTPESLYLRFFPKIRLRNIGLYIKTTSGQVAKVKVDKDLRKLIP